MVNTFISNTSIVSINFRATLDAQNAGNCTVIVRIGASEYSARNYMCLLILFVRAYPLTD
jgi:hypothetical protein